MFVLQMAQKKIDSFLGDVFQGELNFRKEIKLILMLVVFLVIW